MAQRSHIIMRALMLLCLLSVTAPIAAHASQFGTNLRNLNISLPIESFKERQFRGVIRQNYDFSCGAASLATILYHHYNYDVTEKEIVELMYSTGDKKKIVKEGFSLLDMKKYLASLGLNADGFRAPLSKLQKVGVPAIALINNNGFLHFVVIKGVSDDLVLVGDPALGKRVIERKKFEAMWNGILFVIKNDKQVARNSFNRRTDWHVTESPEFGAALNNADLASFTVHISPTPNYFF